jgi:transcriptional regulator with XRE-family HTH domain
MPQATPLLPPPKPPAALALQLRRVKLQLSQEKVALDAGMSQAAYSDIERGARDLLSVPTGRVIALARALNWTLEEMQEATGVDFGLVNSTRRTTAKPDPDAVTIEELEQEVRRILAENSNFLTESGSFFERQAQEMQSVLSRIGRLRKSSS